MVSWRRQNQVSWWNDDFSPLYLQRPQTRLYRRGTYMTSLSRLWVYLHWFYIPHQWRLRTIPSLSSSNHQPSFRLTSLLTRTSLLTGLPCSLFSAYTHRHTRRDSLHPQTTCSARKENTKEHARRPCGEERRHGMLGLTLGTTHSTTHDTSRVSATV